ncbi:MAG: ABC transporter substrate-binding protein [Alistipes sp.]|nr:ABC transporter substrate-binding protein [Alistipes sp.]
MKKNIWFSGIVAIVALLGLSLSSCNNYPRENTLKIYNWSDYIDEELIAEFEEWYQQQTGEEVHVIYQLFDINEVMLSKIEKGQEDFDLVCPSDYIIERMLAHDLALPIFDDEFRSFPDSINYIGNVSPYIQGLFSKLVMPDGKNPNDYSVGYMWGTVGILYNKAYATAEETDSWAALFNPKFRNKMFIKDAFRDVYSPMLVYAKTLEAREKGELGEDEYLSLDQIEALSFDSSDESIALVESYLKRISPYVSGWEADFGKEMMTSRNPKAYINLQWSGDAVFAMTEAENVGVELDYNVPREGSNVWFDGWVIPKYAKNVKAARYFIDFMCRPDNAIRNMEATGYVSVIGTEEVLEAMTDEDMPTICDLTYFFTDDEGNPLAGAQSVHIDDVLYPDRSVVERCAMMHDSGARTEALLDMWSRVKSNM